MPSSQATATRISLDPMLSALVRYEAANAAAPPPVPVAFTFDLNRYLKPRRAMVSATPWFSQKTTLFRSATAEAVKAMALE